MKEASEPSKALADEGLRNLFRTERQQWAPEVNDAWSCSGQPDVRVAPTVIAAQSKQTPAANPTFRPSGQIVSCDPKALRHFMNHDGSRHA